MNVQLCSTCGKVLQSCPHAPPPQRRSTAAQKPTMISILNGAESRAAKKNLSGEKEIKWTEMISLLGHDLLPNTCYQAFLMIFSLTMMFGEIILNVLQPMMMRNMLELLTDATLLDEDDSEEDKELLKHDIDRALFMLFATTLGPLFCMVLKNQSLSMASLPISQRISARVFTHLHHQSMRFHINRQTGQLLRIIELGTSAIEPFIKVSVFEVIATLVQAGLTIYLLNKLGYFPIFLAVFISIVGFALWFALLSGLRNRLQRRANTASVALRHQATESLLNFESIKLYGAEDVEERRYLLKQDVYMEADLMRRRIANGMTNIGAFTIRNSGMVAGLLIACDRVVAGEMAVGSFVMVQL